MAPQSATVASLTPSKSKYQMTARATRIWEVNPNTNNQPLSIDMVLLDREGNHIHATIPKRLVSSYKDTLAEGVIYDLQHFEVAPNTRSYRPVNTTNNIIKCTPFTIISQEKDQQQPIPLHKFEFCSLENLPERTGKIDYLIDVVGLLTTVENRQEVLTKNGKAQLRHIYIQDEREDPVSVTLWGDVANLIDESIVQQDGKEKTIVITSTKVVYYEGDHQLQSTYGTKIYLDLDIPEASKLLHSKRDQWIQVKYADYNTNKANASAPLPIKSTITTLMQMELPDEKQVYICDGKITEIRTDLDWKYISCTSCKIGLPDDNKCPQCTVVVDYPLQRYRLMATVSDGTTDGSIVIFDKEAEKIIGRPITKMLDLCEMENGKAQVFDILQQCIGKEYTFKVKVGVNKFGSNRELKCQKTFNYNDLEDFGMDGDDKEQRHHHEQCRSTEINSMKTPEKKEKRKGPQHAAPQRKATSCGDPTAKKKRTTETIET